LAVIAKYTAIFATAGFFILLVFRADFSLPFKHIWSDKWKYALAFCLFALVLTPVIIYNIELYRTTHLFDSTFASMIGADNVFKTKPTFNLPHNVASTVYGLVTSDFAPFVILSIFAFLWLCIKALRDKTTVFERSLLLYTALLFAMF